LIMGVNVEIGPAALMTSTLSWKRPIPRIRIISTRLVCATPPAEDKTDIDDALCTGIAHTDNNGRVFRSPRWPSLR